VLDSKIWSVLTPPDSNYTHYTLPVLINETGIKWFIVTDQSNYKYLIRYDGLKYNIFSNPNWTNQAVITCIFADSDGSIWIGSRNDGLYCFDPIAITAVEITSSPLPNSPYPHPTRTHSTPNNNQLYPYQAIQSKSLNLQPDRPKSP